jgi:hypothetical protein
MNPSVAASIAPARTVSGMSSFTTTNGMARRSRHAVGQESSRDQHDRRTNHSGLLAGEIRSRYRLATDCDIFPVSRNLSACTFDGASRRHQPAAGAQQLQRGRRAPSWRPGAQSASPSTRRDARAWRAAICARRRRRSSALSVSVSRSCSCFPCAGP